MTIGAWVGFVVILGALAGAVGLTYYLSDGDLKATIIAVFICIAIAIASFIGMRWYYANTASGARAFKTQQSELQNGVERTVTVYDMEGDVIKKYSGKFDVIYDSNRILFDDENGKRHTIYYSTGTVTIDEN